MSISRLLSRNARKYPAHQAIVTERTVLANQGLNEAVNQFTSSLHHPCIGLRDNTKEFVVNHEKD
ncbi:MAG: hypothetical protein ACQET6_02485 [Bacillota bacterium]|uniref:hypothetical protein n=1 Tax=Rossellomorea sp. FM04394 TaxID=3243076 RepID=UPI0035A722B1